MPTDLKGNLFNYLFFFFFFSDPAVDCSRVGVLTILMSSSVDKERDSSRTIGHQGVGFFFPVSQLLLYSGSRFALATLLDALQATSRTSDNSYR